MVSTRRNHAGRCAERVCMSCLQPECGANPFKCWLIRPSTPFPLSRSVLFHSTPNYFNPLIARRAADECVWKCGHISPPPGPRHGVPLALRGSVALAYSTGVLLRSKIRCQGILFFFCAPVGIPAPLPELLAPTPR